MSDKGYSEGDRITVKVNGRAYETHFVDGVQRFVGNPIVAAFVDASSDSYNQWCRKTNPATRNWDEAPFTLNNVDYTPGGQYTLDELIEFSTLHQYSVAGLCDLSFMTGVEVLNPLWEE